MKCIPESPLLCIHSMEMFVVAIASAQEDNNQGSGEKSKAQNLPPADVHQEVVYNQIHDIDS